MTSFTFERSAERCRSVATVGTAPLAEGVWLATAVRVVSIADAGLRLSLDAGGSRLLTNPYA